MTAVVNVSAQGNTIEYNGIQFGGGDSPYRMTPPNYTISGQNVYDESGLAVLYTRYTMSVQTILTESSQAQLELNMGSFRYRLMEAGKTLSLRGVAFDSFNTTVNSMDHEGGPKPLGIQCNPLGYLAWECIWTVQFSIKLTIVEAGGFSAFNFSTTWQNDFEGSCTRTIAGYFEILHERNKTDPSKLKFVADQFRNNINVVCPAGFRRITNTWQENQTHNRLDFVVVDEQLPGDVPIPGFTKCEGDVSFVAGDGKGGFNEGLVTLNMAMTVAPNQPRSLAGHAFIAAVMAKQASMARTLGTKGVVLPISLQIKAAKFDRARSTVASCTWRVTKCLNDMLKAAGLWDPITTNINGRVTPSSAYNVWRASVNGLWNNRGTAGLQSLVSEATIVDLSFAGTNNITIGNSPVNSDVANARTLPSLSCPEVPLDGGWITHDMEIRVLREDPQTWHKVAASPTISAVTSNITTGTYKLGGGDYTQSESEKDIAEKNGYPTTLVAVRFKALRFKHQPTVPELISISGNKATLVQQDGMVPRVILDSFGCPVWFVNSYRIYRVTGSISTIKTSGSPTSCSTNQSASELGQLKL